MERGRLEWPTQGPAQGQNTVLLDIADGTDVLSVRTGLIMWNDDLDAIVTAHQDAILGSPELGNAHGQPYADRQQRNCKGESGHIRQHSLPIVGGVFAVPLVA